MSTADPSDNEQPNDGAGKSLLATITRQYAHYATVGIMFPVATALGFFLGYLIDNWLDTAPLFAFIGLVLGVAAAIRNLLRVVASDENSG